MGVLTEIDRSAFAAYYRAQMDSGRAEAKYAGWIEAIRHL